MPAPDSFRPPARLSARAYRRRVDDPNRSARRASPATSRLRLVVAFWVQWLVCAGFWLVFVGSFDLPELYAGALVATVAAIASNVVLEDKIALFYAHPSWLALALRLPKEIAVDTFLVGRVLLRRMTTGKFADSAIRTVPFDPGGDDGESSARRALAIGYGTAPPNSIVLGIDRKKGLLVYHQLEPAPVSKLLATLGAKP